MTNDSNMQTIDAADGWHTDRHTVVVSAAKLVISAARLGSLIDTVEEALAPTGAATAGESGAVPIRVMADGDAQNVIIDPRTPALDWVRERLALTVRRRVAIKYGASPEHAASACRGSSAPPTADAS